MISQRVDAYHLMGSCFICEKIYRLYHMRMPADQRIDSQFTKLFCNILLTFIFRCFVLCSPVQIGDCVFYALRFQFLEAFFDLAVKIMFQPSVIKGIDPLRIFIADRNRVDGYLLTINAS